MVCILKNVISPIQPRSQKFGVHSILDSCGLSEGSFYRITETTCQQFWRAVENPSISHHIFSVSHNGKEAHVGSLRMKQEGRDNIGCRRLLVIAARPDKGTFLGKADVRFARDILETELA